MSLFSPCITGIYILRYMEEWSCAISHQSLVLQLLELGTAANADILAGGAIFGSAAQVRRKG
jgi:hypothetical protein